MTETSFGALVVRMVISMVVVLGLLFGAYTFMRRRQGHMGRSGPSGRSLRGGSMGGSSGAGRLLRLAVPGLTSSGMNPSGKASGRGANAPKSTSSRRALRIVGRVGIGRATQVVALQFGEQVFLLAASEHAAPAVLGQLALDEWLDASERNDDLIPMSTAMSTATPTPTAGTTSSEFRVPAMFGATMSSSVTSSVTGSVPVGAPLERDVQRDGQRDGQRRLVESLREATVRRG